MTAPGALWITTPRVVLRRPRRDDLADHLRVHSDPRTYAHAPESMPTPERRRERLEADLDDWSIGIGYAAVVDRESGEVIGWAGLRHKNSDDGFLNLYYRLTHDRLGRGLGREISRALVAWAIEHRPEVPVTALVDDVNAASLATARSSGLVEVGTRVNRDDPPDAEPMILFEAPRVTGLDRGRPHPARPQAHRDRLPGRRDNGPRRRRRSAPLTGTGRARGRGREDEFTMPPLCEAPGRPG